MYHKSKKSCMVNLIAKLTTPTVKLWQFSQKHCVLFITTESVLHTKVHKHKLRMCHLRRRETHTHGKTHQVKWKNINSILCSLCCSQYPVHSTVELLSVPTFDSTKVWEFDRIFFRLSLSLSLALLFRLCGLYWIVWHTSEYASYACVSRHLNDKPKSTKHQENRKKKLIPISDSASLSVCLLYLEIFVRIAKLFELWTRKILIRIYPRNCSKSECWTIVWWFCVYVKSAKEVNRINCGREGTKLLIRKRLSVLDKLRAENILLYFSFLSSTIFFFFIVRSGWFSFLFHICM